MSDPESIDDTGPKLIDGSKYAHMDLEEPPTQHGLLAFVLLILSLLILFAPNLFVSPGGRSPGIAYPILAISTGLDTYGIISAIRGLCGIKERGISSVVLLMLLGWTGILALLWLVVVTGSGLMPFM